MEDCPVCFRLADIGFDSRVLRRLYEVRCRRHNSEVVLYYAPAEDEDIVETVRRFACWGCDDCPLAEYDENGDVVKYRERWADVKGA